MKVNYFCSFSSSKGNLTSLFDPSHTVYLYPEQEQCLTCLSSFSVVYPSPRALLYVSLLTASIWWLGKLVPWSPSSSLFDEDGRMQLNHLEAFFMRTVMIVSHRHVKEETWSAVLLVAKNMCVYTLLNSQYI